MSFVNVKGEMLYKKIIIDLKHDKLKRVFTDVYLNCLI